MTIPAEILGAILGALLTALIGGGAWYYKTHVGNRVILEKVTESSLMKLSDKVSGDLSITYRGKQIKDLFFYEFNIYNEGFINISNFEVTINFKGESGFSLLKFQSDSLLGECEISVGLIDDNSTKMVITRPYLNMRKQNKKEVINLQFITDSKITPTVKGGGLGWFVVCRNHQPRKSNFIFALGIGFISMMVGIFINSFINDYYNAFEVKVINETLNIISLVFLISAMILLFFKYQRDVNRN